MGDCMKKVYTVCITLLLLIIVTSAENLSDFFDPNNDVALAKESEEFCASTGSTKATSEMIIKKVNEAIKILETKGVEGYKELKGKDSKFLFAGTYLWINDYDGVMLMHPIKPGLVTKPLLNLKDSNGKLLFLEMVTKVKSNNEGWVSYMWPKPGEKARSLKVSFVKKAVINGKPVVVGCGTYDLSEAEVKALTKE